MLDKLFDDARIEELRCIIKNGENFVIVAHKNPDGDAVGSSLAFMLYLRGLGKRANVLLPNAFPDFLKWLPAASEVVLYENEKEKATTILSAADAIFCLDFNSIPRLGEMSADVLAATAPKVLIDHHLHPDEGFLVSVSVPEACSTAELVFRVIKSLSSIDAINKDIAEAVYTGMMTDTGSFAYASNRKDIYLIVADLISKGVDKDLLYRKVFYNYTESRLKLMGYVLYEKLKFYPEYNASLITLTHKELKQFKIMKGDTEGLVNMPLQKKGMRFSCFLREEQPGKINVSLRSVGDFPCNTLAAEFFGGGGHKNASGGEVHDTMEVAVEKFLAAIEAYKNKLS